MVYNILQMKQQFQVQNKYLAFMNWWYEFQLST